MADERIDIEINDKIAASIPKKLRDIAANADKADNSVKRLKADLASINATPARRLKEATDGVTNSLNRELNAQKSVKVARDATVSGLSKEAAQRDRIARMVDASIAAQQRENAALRDRMSAGGTIGDPTAGSRAIASAQTAELRAETERLSNARRADAAAARLQEGATEAATGAMRRNGAAAGMNRQHLLNLGFQLQDIVVGLTSGQKPMTVFLQQGAQIQGIMGQAGIGVRGLASSVWQLVGRFVPLLAVLGAAAAAFKLFQADLNNDEPAKKFAAGLGLTRSELKQLQDVTITTGDMFNGLWKTISDRTGVDESLSAMKNFFIETFRTVMRVAFDVTAAIYAAFIGTYRAIKNNWQNLPGLLGGFFIAAANLGIAALEQLHNNAIQILNLIGSGINKVLGTEIGEIAEVHLPRIEAAAGTTARAVQDEFTGAFEEARSGMRDFYEDWGKNSEEAMRDRLRNQANEIIADRSPSSTNGREDKTAENRAQALRLVNMELDNELARMRLLKPEREVQQRMDQIEQELARKKITLSELERAAIEGKVRAIMDYAHVQAEADRILEASIAPQRTYNATIQAANELLRQGAINQEAFNRETVLAGRALAEATDPLFSLKEAMDAATVAAGLYGQEVQRNNYYESIRQAFLAKGVVLSQQYVAGVNAEADALMRKNEALTQQQYIQSQIGAIVDPMLQDQMFLDNKANLYAEVDRLRQNDVLSEEQAERAKASIRARYNEINLQGYSQFFGKLAGLSSSGNKKLAAIGKAAAVAQATIDGFVAVQKALASAPPPLNFALAAATAVMTGVQVAGILSTNVGSFATGGQFMVDGKAGVDRNNINMNVSRGERVTIETPAQQRANDGGSGTTVDVPVKIVNQFDRREFLSEMAGDEGERIILNVIKSNPEAINATINR